MTGTAREFFSARTLVATLKRVVGVAVATVDGCDFAGIFLVEGASIVTPVHSDPVVVEIDELQHRTGEGPCFDAIAVGDGFYAAELTDDARWLHFGPLADRAGIRSVLALRLASEDTHGALNLYTRYPDAFGVLDRANGLLLAQLAAVALSSAQSHDVEARRMIDLQAALVTRELIGSAEGILVERERITSDQAFDVLRRASRRLNVKLKDVAQTLVDAGLDPGADGSRATS